MLDTPKTPDETDATAPAGDEATADQYSTEPDEMQRSEDELDADELHQDSPFINRELSWLAFNRRVLSEAKNKDNPLLERVRFLSITASNLDEFFMVRFAGLRHRMMRGSKRRDPTGMMPDGQFRAVMEDAEQFMGEQMRVLRESILPALSREGIKIWKLAELNGPQLRWIEGCFREEILPRIVPAIHGPGAKPPQVSGRALQFGFLLQDNRGEMVLATLQAPAGLQRLWGLPEELDGGYVLLEDMMTLFSRLIEPSGALVGCWPFRITRDEDFIVSESSPMHNLVAETKRSLKKRKNGAVVRLEVDAAAPEAFGQLLQRTLQVYHAAVYAVDGPLNLTFLVKELYHLQGRPALRYPPFTGRIPAQLDQHANIFEALHDGDIFLHHPYDSFDTVLQFVMEAATDPRVLAISMTLYRVSGNSPVIRALCDAAERGKHVTVLLELKARFDEENNLRWCDVLRQAGCDVLYGMPQIKTHSKIALVVRREGGGLQRYVHLGTGNYNDVTARQYTDMGLMTADADLGEDAQSFFNMITGFSREPRMRKLVYAPRTLRDALGQLIDGEIAHARAGRPSGIVAKMNSLVDPQIVQMLYDASRAGVAVRLIVRGVCCLQAGVPGISDHIEVRSIVGRFLEHSRVFCFENGGENRIFLSSADWMPRNLNRRIELMFPVEDPAVRARVRQVLDMQWSDTAKAWRMRPDGVYERVQRTEPAFNAQEALLVAPYPI